MTDALHAYASLWVHNPWAAVILHMFLLLGLLAWFTDSSKVPGHVCHFSWMRSNLAHDAKTGEVAALCCTYRGCDKFITPEEMECE